jgi:hypothetical protein
MSGIGEASFMLGLGVLASGSGEPEVSSTKLLCK